MPSFAKPLAENDIFQGTWTRKLNPDILYLAAAVPTYTFTGDSFYAKIDNFTDAINPNDSCLPDYWWETYAAGTYTSTADSVFFTGFYTDSLFSKRISGCTYGALIFGPYDFSYSYKAQGDTITLTNRPYAWATIKLVKMKTSTIHSGHSVNPIVSKRIIKSEYFTLTGRKLPIKPGVITGSKCILIKRDIFSGNAVSIKKTPF